MDGYGWNLNHPRLYPLVTCKFNNYTINTKGVIIYVRNVFSFILVYWKMFDTQGHVTLKKYSDLAQNQTRPGFYACPGHPQVWRESYQN